MRIPIMFMIATIFIMLLAAATVKGMADLEVKRPVSKYQWTQDAEVWGVRSVIGEVGWGNPSKPYEANNEWVSVMGVYATRVKETGWPLVKIIRKYSAAVKNPSIHKRSWLAGIQPGCSRPEKWPDNLNWDGVHKPICERAFLVLDRWANGDIKTLTPTANHYGGSMDAWRAENVLRWSLVVTPSYYKNRFYDSHNPVKLSKLDKFGISVMGVRNNGVPMFGNIELVRPQ